MRGTAPDLVIGSCSTLAMFLRSRTSNLDFLVTSLYTFRGFYPYTQWAQLVPSENRWKEIFVNEGFLLRCMIV